MKMPSCGMVSSLPTRRRRKRAGRSYRMGYVLGSTAPPRWRRPAETSPRACTRVLDHVPASVRRLLHRSRPASLRAARHRLGALPRPPHLDPALERHPGRAPTALRRLRTLGPQGQVVAGRALATPGRPPCRALGVGEPAHPAVGRQAGQQERAQGGRRRLLPRRGHLGGGRPQSDGLGPQRGRPRPSRPSPWGGEPLALPVMVCLHRKSKEGATEEEEELSLIELAAWMVFQLIEWLPNHRFRLVADGAYAPILRYEFQRTAVITRIRRDAALFDLAPPRTGRRGRPRTKGQRLATPLGMAAALTDAAGTTVQVCVRGRMAERKLWSRTVLWYETARSRPLLLVIIRDPSGHQHNGP